MHKAALAFIDWFIASAPSAGRSDAGLARNFVVSQLVGPVLLLPIAFFIYCLDAHPGSGFYLLVACIAGCWLMPLGLKVTRNFRLVALISVQLLCMIALLGASLYGGMTSPFLPWLLVSLMLGFFYLSDRALLVLALFAFNIAATLVANLIHPCPQDVAVQDLTGVTWLSIFTATAYMSRMALYYANIVTMSSALERAIELHRTTASELRAAKERTDAENRGKSIFLEKMSRQVQVPLGLVIERSQALLDQANTSPAEASTRPELEKINAAGQKLRSVIIDVLNVENVTAGQNRLDADKSRP